MSNLLNLSSTDDIEITFAVGDGEFFGTIGLCDSKHCYLLDKDIFEVLQEDIEAVIEKPEYGVPLESWLTFADMLIKAAEEMKQKIRATLDKQED